MARGARRGPQLQLVAEQRGEGCVASVHGECELAIMGTRAATGEGCVRIAWECGVRGGRGAARCRATTSEGCVRIAWRVRVRGQGREEQLVAERRLVRGA